MRTHFRLSAEIPSFQGPHSRLPTICNWNHGHSGIQWSEGWHPKEKHSRIHPFLPQHPLPHSCKSKKYINFIIHALSYFHLFFYIYIYNESQRTSPMAGGLSNFRERRDWTIHWNLRPCGLFWSSWCSCSRWYGGRPVIHVPGIHAG